MLIVDACRSGGAIRQMETAFSRAGQANLEVEVFTSTDARTNGLMIEGLVFSRWDHSIYSKALSDELKSANLDLNGDEFVDVDEFDVVLQASAGIAAAQHDASAASKGRPLPNGQVGTLVPEEAVLLDQPLLDPQTGTTVFPPGAAIELRRITGGIRAQPESGCLFLHLHGFGVGIIVDGTSGPFPDPNPPGCGYGKIITVYRFAAR